MLNALYNGRHCIVNREMVDGTGLETICHIVEGVEDMRSKVVELYSLAIQPDEISKRKQVLAGIHNRDKNVKRLLHSIWSDESLPVEG